MKILYIVTQGEQGGAQKSIFDLASGMKEKGHEVFVAVGEIENEGDKWLHQELFKVGVPAYNLIEIKSLQREIKIGRDIKSLFDTIKIIKKIKPDIVHLHSSKAGVVGGLASFLTRTKSLYTVHGFVFLEPMNILKKILYIFLEFISSLCRKFTILITELDIKTGKKFFILRNKNKYKLIYNGITDKNKNEMLSKQEAREYFLGKIPPLSFGKTSAPIVGTISNLYKTKGLEYLIDAAAIVVKEKPNAIFVVLGFGEDKYQKELQERIKKNNLENNFFLFGKTPSAFKYLKGFDLFTLTSVKEGLPYTLLEAKMAGVPILASDVGGIPEIAKNIPMELAEVKNVEQISNKILELISPSLEGVAASRGSQDDSLPKVYSLENMLNSTEEIYKILSKS